MKVLFIIVVAALFISVGTAQPLPYALGGHIYDTENNYVVGAEITLQNTRTNDTLVLTSSTDGEYQTDAYNFVDHYKDNDNIIYTVTYKDVGATETAKIDVSKGGTILDIVLNNDYVPEATPKQRKQTTTKTTTKMYVDTDGDGISDLKEKLKGSNPNDACDPNINCAQCVATTVTPEVFTPMEDVVAHTPEPVVQTPVPIATPVATLTPTQKPKRIVGFSGLLCIISLAVVFVIRKRR